MLATKLKDLSSSGVVIAHVFNPRRQISEFKARVSSRTAKGMQRNSVLKNNNKQTNNQSSSPGPHVNEEEQWIL